MEPDRAGFGETQTYSYNSGIVDSKPTFLKDLGKSSNEHYGLIILKVTGAAKDQATARLAVSDFPNSLGAGSSRS